MRKIYFATTNAGKILAAKSKLAPLGFRVVQVKTEIDEPEHTKDSRKIVRAKCAAALKKVGGPVICEDGGFFVKAFGWKPGVSIHGYLETPNSKGMRGVEKLLYDLRNSKDRRAYFLNVSAYMEAGWREPIYFSSKVEGKVLKAQRGRQRARNWSPVHLVFVPDLRAKTMAEMSDREYAEFSDEVSTFKKMAGWLAQREW